MQRAGGAFEHDVISDFVLLGSGRKKLEKTRPDQHGPRSHSEQPGPEHEGCGAIKAHEACVLTCFSESSFGKQRKEWT